MKICGATNYEGYTLSEIKSEYKEICLQATKIISLKNEIESKNLPLDILSVFADVTGLAQRIVEERNRNLLFRFGFAPSKKFTGELRRMGQRAINLHLQIGKVWNSNDYYSVYNMNAPETNLYSELRNFCCLAIDLDNIGFELGKRFLDTEENSSPRIIDESGKTSTWWKRPEVLIPILIAAISIPWWPNLISYAIGLADSKETDIYFDEGEVPEDRVINATTEYSKIRRLAAGVQISLFQDVLGKESFINKLSNDIIEYVFVNPLYYVEAATDTNNNVVFFSITTRESNFNPKFEFGPWYKDVDQSLVVELGKSKYADLASAFRNDPIYAEYSAGVNEFYYYESYYVGRPGNYQTYIFSTNQAGAEPNWPLMEQRQGKIDNTTIYSHEVIEDQEWIDYRENSTINTLTITSPWFGMQDFLELDKMSPGPDLQQVRVLE